jgi:Fe-S cluster biosynthesis and repair protein YggX
LGFDNLKEMYRDDPDFKEAYEASENPILRNISQWTEYMIHNGLLFTENRLCILKCSMRENLLKEKHNGGLVGHFGHDKMFSKLNISYYWQGMRTNVQKFMDR